MLEEHYRTASSVPTWDLVVILVLPFYSTNPSITRLKLSTAFGGFGFTSRMWGLTLDAIIAINLVLPNGTITRASQQTHPDLFWVILPPLRCLLCFLTGMIQGLARLCGLIWNNDLHRSQDFSGSSFRHCFSIYLE